MPQFAEVVDFPVEGEHDPAVGRGHRLGARGREVDDCQAGVRQADASLRPSPLAIRPSVRDGCTHFGEQGGRKVPEVSSDAAHVRLVPP